MIAAVADWATTLRFFHAAGIDREVHPGIRLFGYAYGRTLGPTLGKAVQVLGLLLISRFQHRYCPWLLIVAGAMSLLAAVVNSVV